MRKALAVVFAVISLILIEPLGNESTVDAYWTSIDLNSADSGKEANAAFMHCVNMGHDEVISWTVTFNPHQVRSVACRG